LFQPLLVAWALHSTGSWEWLRDQSLGQTERTPPS
jgi:hypothetical protein